ncbi:hypothetical protein CHUAL_006073 [Chamberlinius hualienensis]
MSPIDPLQLLKALGPLLSHEGGIKSLEEVGRIASLMKKFSKKLVSRCIYINVLRASSSEALEGFLQKGGWETIHSWLEEGKSNQNQPFLLELLKLYRALPMTVERLKENNSAKLVKSLSKSDNEDIKMIATELVNNWVKLVKGDSDSSSGKSNKDEKSVKKKKKKDEKEVKSDKEKSKDRGGEKKESKKDEMKKDGKNSSTTKENKVLVKAEDLEDVQLPDFIRNPEPKDTVKPKERKSTVKLYQTKFRSTGLDEPVQLPRQPVKKTADKVPPLIISKNSIKRIGSSLSKELGPIPKKPKLPHISLPKIESDSSVKELNEKYSPITNERREIKLIAPRPKPIHTITESAGFMDALVAPVQTPIRKKKKLNSKVPTTPPLVPVPASASVPAPQPQPPPTPTPTPPPVITPKLQFYKDTLEVQEDEENSENTKQDGANKSLEIQEGEMEESSMTLDENSITSEEIRVSPKESENVDDMSEINSNIASNKRKRKNKKVSWADDNNLKEVFYFELDETERVNVNNVKNFGDLKTLERLKEREAVENARRSLMGTGEERMAWFLHFIDNLQSLIIPGCNSKEREIQKSREECVLQEIFFSKESLPETPHEPDPEHAEPEEPKIIPLEDENNPDAVMDYSMLEPPAPVTTLPPALSSLFSSLGKVLNPMEGGDYNMYINMPNNDPSQQMPPNFLPPGVPNMMGPNHGMMGGGPGPVHGHGHGPGPYNNMGGYPPRPPMGGPPPFGGDGMDYYGNQGPDMGGPSGAHGGGGGHMGRSPRGPPGGPRGGPNRGWGPPRGQPNNNRNRGGGGGRGGRGRVPCHHFMAGGCKYEQSCKFLHPGVNGPPL